jgi:hypothetical protein
VQKTCRQCQSAFEITDSDLAFFEKASPIFNGSTESFSHPTLCPYCRQQRRWAVRNENHLYRRTCDLTGKPIISLYPPDSNHKVFGEDAYRGNAWNPMDEGRPYDFSRSFFMQFGELLLTVPRRGLQQDGSNENCEYITYGYQNKNCYLAFACLGCQDVYHSTRLAQVKDASDCLLCVGGELMYECINCTRLYQCAFCIDSHGCQDSLLLDHCQDCRHCIGCKNLRNKEYHIENKPVSPEEFDTRRKALFTELEHERMKFDEWKMQFPSPFAHLTLAEDCTGDYIYSAKNCKDCFEIHLGAEDCRHCQVSGAGIRDVVDSTMAGKGDLLYETIGIGPGHRCSFVYFAGDVSDSYYCSDFFNCSHCFGCVGIEHKQYCILNKQYTKEEYDVLAPQIITAMRKTGEWGEFFPLALSTFAYNDTIAQERFPLTKEQAVKQGLHWNDRQETVVSQTPTKEEDVLTCEVTGKPFRVTKQERSLLEHMGLPLPRVHPIERHLRRLGNCKPHRLWNRLCARCQKPVDTSYSPENKEIVYCEECYLAAVY